MVWIRTSVQKVSKVVRLALILGIENERSLFEKTRKVKQRKFELKVVFGFQPLTKLTYMTNGSKKAKSITKKIVQTMRKIYKIKVVFAIDFTNALLNFTCKIIFLDSYPKRFQRGRGTKNQPKSNVQRRRSGREMIPKEQILKERKRKDKIKAYQNFKHQKGSNKKTSAKRRKRWICFDQYVLINMFC